MEQSFLCRLMQNAGVTFYKMLVVIICNVSTIKVQGWGSLNYFLLISPLKVFYIINYMLDSTNHIDVWQISPQLNCGDICQTSMWNSTGKQCFNDSEKRRKWIKEIGLLIPTPVREKWTYIVCRMVSWNIPGTKEKNVFMTTSISLFITITLRTHEQML